MDTPNTSVRRDALSILSLMAGAISVLLWGAILIVYFYQARLFPGGEDVHFLEFGLIFGCLPYITVFLSILALISGIISLRRNKKLSQGDTHLPVAGIVLGALGLLPVIVLFSLFIPIVSSMFGS